VERGAPAAARRVALGVAALTRRAPRPGCRPRAPRLCSAASSRGTR
jgi:hypothetical protein